MSYIITRCSDGCFVKLTDEEMVTILHAVEVGVDIADDTSTEELFHNGEETISRETLTAMREATSVRIDGLLNITKAFTKLEVIMTRIVIDR
jgi:hypothetical protein